MEKIKLEVVNDNIIGTHKDGFNLYLIIWERIANNSFIYCWASSEEEAYKKYSYQFNKNVRHTIIKLDIKNMPVTDGREKN